MRLTLQPLTLAAAFMKAAMDCGNANLVSGNIVTRYENPQAESSWIITQYLGKERVENDFKLLKDPELIRWRPSRHWTDTKICAFGFCCVMALLLIQVMLQKVERAGMRMSAAVLKEELTDLKEIVMLYDENHAVMKVSQRSSIQQRLWDLFRLGSVEKRLPYTN